MAAFSLSSSNADTPTHIRMYHCPQLSGTSLSPQAICESAIAICFEASPSTVQISTTPMFVSIATVLMIATPMHLSHAATIFIILHNYSLLLMDNVFSQPRIVSPLSSPSELWQYLRLGHPGMHQLRHLQQCSTGLPPRASISPVHPLHACPTCDSARSRRPPLGPTSTATDPIPGSRFHLDFGFMRAKSVKHVPQNQNSHPRCSITMTDLHLTVCLLTLLHVTRGVFLSRPKTPPFQLVSEFLQEHGLTRWVTVLSVSNRRW
jgi:hypothetical protein